MIEIYVADDAGALTAHAADVFRDTAAAAIADRGRFGVALSGGSTPRALFQLLAAEPYRSGIPWEKVHLFWGDERSVGPDDPDSNYRMAREALISKVPVPEANVVRMRGEAEDLDAAAREYEASLRAFFETPDAEAPRFDLLMLGMGDDGHTL